MSQSKSTSNHANFEGPHFSVPPEATDTTADPDIAAWEEVEAGRFMPRRVRGSFRGRALG